MNIKDNITNILLDLDEKVKLVAVSKTKPTNYILKHTKQVNAYLEKIKFKINRKVC